MATIGGKTANAYFSLASLLRARGSGRSTNARKKTRTWGSKSRALPAHSGDLVWLFSSFFLEFFSPELDNRLVARSH